MVNVRSSQIAALCIEDIYCRTDRCTSLLWLVNGKFWHINLINLQKRIITSSASSRTVCQRCIKEVFRWKTKTTAVILPFSYPGGCYRVSGIKGCRWWLICSIFINQSFQNRIILSNQEVNTFTCTVT